MQEEICKLLLVVGNLEPGNKDLGTGILKLGLGICDKNMGPGDYVSKQSRFQGCF